MNRLGPETASIAAGAASALGASACCVLPLVAVSVGLGDACLFFWNCPSCSAPLKPKSGDCCVFCSYGSVPCPPMQAARGCCT